MSALLMVALALDQLERVETAVAAVDDAITQAGKLDDPLVRMTLKSAYTVCNHDGLHFDDWDFLSKLLGAPNLC